MNNPMSRSPVLARHALLLATASLLSLSVQAANLTRDNGAAVGDNQQRRLKPEMYARVVLVGGDGATSVRVANSAIVTQGLYSFVFVETEPGLFKRRRITVMQQDREFAYLSEGPAVGDRLVTTGALLLNSELATAVK